MVVRFEDWILDGETRELLRDGAAVHLSPKAFDLLAALLSCRPRAMSKAELHEQVWPGVFVSEATLSSLVCEVRETLGDSAGSPRFVRTVHGFGYAFCGSATDAAKRATADASYRLIWGRREIDLPAGESVVGRTRDVSLWIDSSEVSRRHARIVIADARATIEDLGSKNGTRVRGARITQTTELADGDEIRLGSVSLTFRVLPKAESTVTGPGS